MDNSIACMKSDFALQKFRPVNDETSYRYSSTITHFPCFFLQNKPYPSIQPSDTMGNRQRDSSINQNGQKFLSSLVQKAMDLPDRIPEHD
mmetsp:Transcript_7320/g.17855  ORF Transcript_7320/g.17855 Transcript_7320/m.17855 type:complete len:90 (+) Transcript_7320:1401-1670(+)